MGELINCPQLTVEEFFAIGNGTRVYNHGADQCVALANQYHEGSLGGRFVPVNSAYQWWTDFDSLPQLTELYTQTDSPIRGDVFIARGGIYDYVNGHIGVVSRDWDGSTFGTMEQNAGTGSARWVWRYNRSINNVLGFLRPIQNVPVEDKKEDMRLVLSDPAKGGTGAVAIAGELSFNGVPTQEQLDMFRAVYGDIVSLSGDQWGLLQSKAAERAQHQADLTAGKLGGMALNVDAIVQAIVDKINVGGQPDVTTKAEILSAIETNYPEDK